LPNILLPQKKREMDINKISLGVEAIDSTPQVEGVTINRLSKTVRSTAALARTTIFKIAKVLKSAAIVTINVSKKVAVIALDLGKRTTNLTLNLTKKFINMIKSRLEKRESDGERPLHGSGYRTPLNTNKVKKTFLLLGALVVLIIIAVAVKSGISKSRTGLLSGSTLGDQVEINSPLKITEINREFSFPLNDSKGKEVSNIKYVIQRVELQNEIIVKGQKATAVKGRLFLIVYLKITNEYSQKVQMNTKDYVRLSVNGNQVEWLAPDIHNDPVEIQAQSTKVTRLGFPISESDTKLLLRIGQINGDKQMIELNF